MSQYSKYIKSVFCSLAALTPDFLPELYAKKIILPAYHLVSDSTPPHISALYKARTPKEFIKDMDYLLRHYQPIHLSDLIKIVHEKKTLKKNLFHLSFDDGLKECYDVIAPILKEKGIPATFFLNSDFVGNKHLMFRYKASLLVNKILSEKPDQHKTFIPEITRITYPGRSRLDDLAHQMDLDFDEYLKRQRPYMDESEIKKLISEGFTIGAHSIDHPEYSHVSYEEQIRQTRESINYVSQAFGLAYKVFAFPFNDEFISSRFVDTILNGTEPLADLIFGVAGIKKDYHPGHLQRIPMEKPFTGRSIIKGDYLYYSAKALVGKNKIVRN